MGSMLVAVSIAASLLAIFGPSPEPPVTGLRTIPQELLTPDAGPTNSDVVVRNVRLEPAPPVNGAPAVRVKFELHNEAEHSLAHLIVAISLVVPKSVIDVSRKPRTVAGPLILRVSGPLLPGYSVDYDIVLRNVSAAECECVPAVTVSDVLAESP